MSDCRCCIQNENSISCVLEFGHQPLSVSLSFRSHPPMCMIVKQAAMHQHRSPQQSKAVDSLKCCKCHAPALPSCLLLLQAVIVSCGGRLTVALYTIRHVAPGEELTFDYSCVTESEDEFKQAYCMCSTRHCRGSYLYYTGSKAYMQVRAAAVAGTWQQLVLTVFAPMYGWGCFITYQTMDSCQALHC